MGKSIVLVSHCVLNQNAVVNGLERAEGAFPLAKKIIDKEIGIIQMNCPELFYNGLNREPLNYEDYDLTDYRLLCKDLLEPVIQNLKQYVDNDYNFIGTIGIQNSPACSISNKRGVLMEILFPLLKHNNLNEAYFEIPYEYNEKNLDMLSDLDNFLGDKND